MNQDGYDVYGHFQMTKHYLAKLSKQKENANWRGHHVVNIFTALKISQNLTKSHRTIINRLSIYMNTQNKLLHMDFIIFFCFT